MEQLRGVLNLKGYRIMGRVSEDEDVEKPLTSVESNAPYSDGDGRPYVQTTCGKFFNLYISNSPLPLSFPA